MIEPLIEVSFTQKKVMRSIRILFALTMFSFGAMAQNKANVKVENTNGTYHIKIEKEVDGKKTTIDKIYNSLEEMKNDPELEEINLRFFDNGDNEMVFFEKEGQEGNHKINVIIDVDPDLDHDFSMESGHSFMFKSDGSDGEKLHDIKVWVDEDGETHIMKNGEEIEGNKWIDKDGEEYDISKSEGKVMIFSKDGTTEFDTSGEGHANFYFSTDGEKDGKHERVMVFKSSDVIKDGDGNEQMKIAVKVITELKLHFEEVAENEFNSMAGINAKTLKMEELNYYPNPNSGKFTLQFNADKRPTEIKITNLNGKEIYSEKLSSFEGSYQNEIDLSGQKRGIYLLQIIQGNKATNKKIVIE